MIFFQNYSMDSILFKTYQGFSQKLLLRFIRNPLKSSIFLPGHPTDIPVISSQTPSEIPLGIVSKNPSKIFRGIRLKF